MAVTSQRRKFSWTRRAAWCCLLAAGSSLAQAQSTDPGATIASKGAPNGVTACITCHGANGEGSAATGFPRLAALGAPYIEEQLAAFASGQRQNPIMQPIAKALTAQQITALGAYYSKLPSPLGAPAPSNENIHSADTGTWLALRGRWDDNLPACVQCHGPGGIGVGPAFPPLAGQPVSYISSQLQAFKKKTRPGGPMNLMGVVASKLSDTDITAVAGYYGGLQAAAPSPNANKGKK